MNSIRIVLQLVKKDVLNPRYYLRLVLCFFIILVHYILYMDKQIAYARELELGINALEPFLYLLTRYLSTILVMGSLLFLVSDAPFRDKGDYYAVYRVGRIRWLAAKIMVMIYYVLLFVLVCYLASLFFTLPVGEFAFSFSEFVLVPEVPGINSGRIIRLGANILDNYTLMEAALYASLVFFLWGVTLGLIVLNSNLKYQRAFGIILAIFPATLDRILQMASGGMGKGFLYYMRMENLNKSDCPVTIAVMAAVVFALIVLALIQVGSHSMHEKE